MRTLAVGDEGAAIRIDELAGDGGSVASAVEHPRPQCLGRQPAVDDQLGASHVARVVASEEQHPVRDVVR